MQPERAQSLGCRGVARVFASPQGCMGREEGGGGGLGPKKVGTNNGPTRFSRLQNFVFAHDGHFGLGGGGGLLWLSALLIYLCSPPSQGVLRQPPSPPVGSPQGHWGGGGVPGGVARGCGAQFCGRGVETSGPDRKARVTLDTLQRCATLR